MAGSLLNTIYAHSPVCIQNVMVSVQGFLFLHRRWDLELGRRLLAELRESQWWSAERFQEYQCRALRAHLRYAAAHVPYYQELFRKNGIDPDRVRTVEDLRQIPLLEKRTLRENPTRFLAGGARKKSWNVSFTSGTTGTPMTLYSSRESFTRIWSFVFRLREWAGVDDPVMPRRAAFTGRDIVPAKRLGQERVFWRHNLPGKALLMSTTHLSQDTASQYAEAMNRFRPDVIEGYPSSVLIIARMAKIKQLDLPRPSAIITTAETLFPSHKREIKEAFHCKVFNQYASSDTSSFASECEYGNLHIHPEFGICEILDEQGNPVQPGQEGEVVATSFCNREQVFIRYRIGDTAIAGPAEPCPCGRAMPRLEQVTGRVDDILYIPDRGFVGRLDPAFKGLSSIRECQIVQESLDRLRVLLVPAVGYSDEIEAKLLANLRKKVGSTVGIVVERCSSIPRGPNGKFRSVTSLCQDQYPSSWKMESNRSAGE